MDNFIYIKVRPNAGKDVLISMGAGRFEAWIKSKPVEGRANQAVTDLLVRSLRLTRAQVHLVKGHRGRHKVFRIQE